MARPSSRSIPAYLFPVVLMLGCTNDMAPDQGSEPDESLQSATSVAKNVRVETLELDDDADGSLEQRTVTTTWYDQHGNVVRMVSEADFLGPDGVNRTTTIASFNKRGNQVSRVEEFDRFADGTIDMRTLISAVAFDRHENPIEQLRETDLDGNGTIDAQSSTTFEYDRHGNPIRQVTGNQTSLISYDQHQNPVHISISSQLPLMLTEWDITNTYNAHGALVEEVTIARQNGVVTSMQTWSTSQFDRRGNPVQQVYVGATPLGVLERGARAISYDGVHHVSKFVEEIDQGADGSINWRITYTYEHTGETPTLKHPSGQLDLAASMSDRLERSTRNRR